MAEIKVILVDDHPVVRKGIRDMLDDAPGIRVIGEGASGKEALEQIKAGMPDVLLLDMELPDMSGIELMRMLKAQECRVAILALSAYADKTYITESLASGASGYLIKEEIPENIVEAIRGVSRGEQGWVSRQVAAKLTTWMQEREAGEANHLTPREVEVLRAVVEGKTNQEIGYSLGISDKTVEKHLEGIFAKLGVSSRVEAAVRAVREGLVD